jgi:magnesium-transporting ATPase (P-type)
VLQILALDIGTDTLSAVALGAEPPSRHIIDGPPVGGRLMDRTVVRRAFGLLGPTVALMTMVAFVVSLLAAGWGIGQPWPADHEIAAASGAAFLTVVLAQTANAWACRSSTRTPRRLGWTTNKLLPVTAAIEVCFALAVVFVGPIAERLGHAPPPLWGWVVGLAAMPLVLAVDALDKYRRVGRASRRRIH